MAEVKVVFVDPKDRNKDVVCYCNNKGTQENNLNFNMLNVVLKRLLILMLLKK